MGTSSVAGVRTEKAALVYLGISNQKGESENEARKGWRRSYKGPFKRLDLYSEGDRHPLGDFG